MKMKYFFLALAVFLAACSSEVQNANTTAVNEPRDQIAPPEHQDTPLAQTATPTYPPLNLEHQPLYWFGPLPPMPTNHGSIDFMALFAPGAPWEAASEHLQVFKLYGEWVAYHATNAELRQAVHEIRVRGLALAVEAGPLDRPADCGEMVEGFAGTQEGRLIARRILDAGGTIDFIALDEPYFFARFYDGPGACNWPAEKIAAEVDEYIQVMRDYFPEVFIGDTEPLAGPTTAADYTAWLDIFREVNGYDLAFLHMDIDWSRITWPSEVLQIEEFGRERGIPIGLIYTGNHGDKSDEAWLSIAGERVVTYETENGGNPAHIIFQSWNDHPDYVLPETEAYTFTNFILNYFEDQEALGFRLEGRMANLAFERPARASKYLSGYSPELAVDGDPGTLWSSGDFSPQWIEIDLESPHNILEIHLLPSQSPPGNTVHKVFGKGPGTGGKYILLHTFQEITEDSQVLAYRPTTPWEGIEVIRIETIASPSWIAWREIEIIDAGD